MKEAIFNYHGTGITFQLGNGDVMVNATEMAKSHGKQPVHFLRNDQTQAFITALRNRIPVEPVQVINGDKGGTWIHQKLALKFAAWLSPEFELWVYDRVEELLKHGATAINPDDLLNPDFIIRLATELKEERAQKEMLRLQNEKQAHELKQAAPKVEYHDKVLQSQGLISVTEMANILDFRSAKALNSYLKEIGILRKVNDAWAFTAKYSGKGYGKYKTHPYMDTFGNTKTAQHLYFTESGKRFLIETFVLLGKIKIGA